MAPHIYESAEEARAHLRDAGRQRRQADGTARIMESTRKQAASPTRIQDRPSGTRGRQRVRRARTSVGRRPDAARISLDRSDELGQLYAERLKTDDGYQVIDQRTVAATSRSFVQKAAANPAPIIKEQFALWSDLASLWQRDRSPHSVQRAGRAGHRAGQTGQAVQERALDRESLLRLPEAILPADVAPSPIVRRATSRASIRKPITRRSSTPASSSMRSRRATSWPPTRSFSTRRSRAGAKT